MENNKGVDECLGCYKPLKQYQVIHKYFSLPNDESLLKKFCIKSVIESTRVMNMVTS